MWNMVKKRLGDYYTVDENYCTQKEGEKKEFPGLFTVVIVQWLSLLHCPLCCPPPNGELYSVMVWWTEKFLSLLVLHLGRGSLPLNKLLCL